MWWLTGGLYCTVCAKSCYERFNNARLLNCECGCSAPMVANFKGVAHPPPRRDGKRNNIADLSAAEISTANMGRGGGTQMLVEHDHSGGQVGRVIASWEGPHGELRVQGVIDDPTAERALRSGRMRELSLGTSVHSEDGGRVLMRTHDELSLCERAARPGCIVTDLDGTVVGSTRHFARAKRAQCSR